MKFSLVVCTYQRPQSLKDLLESVKFQSIYPDQILIIDGSLDNKTNELIKEKPIDNLDYVKVDKKDRGLTKQRNIGVEIVGEDIEVVFFLDDDTVLDNNYFEEIIKTYDEYPEALGVAGYITNEVDWRKVSEDYMPSKREFSFDGWVRIEGSRFSLRRKFGLAPDMPPGYMPEFSHGYSTGFLPPSGNTYEVEMIMGGIASYKKIVFDQINFSSSFEGYSLYEDADFSLRLAKLGKLLVNTKALVIHNHAPEGRPNNFKYGKMVILNGWRVWRIRYPSPKPKAILKWHLTAGLLTLIRIGNIFTSSNKRGAMNESLGRIIGWWELMLLHSRNKS